MKRDMELVRLLLLEQETGEVPSELSDYSTEAKIYHYQIMDDAGLVVASFMKDDHGIPVNVEVNRLTWAGHDFLDSTRDSKVWKMAKEQILKPGASWTFSILVEWLKQEARKQIFGIPSGS
jgi:Hypothetical protein (DUF2513)